MEEQQATIEVRLTRAEIELLRTALGLLESTLGREEADELKAVQLLMAKLARQDR